VPLSHASTASCPPSRTSGCGARASTWLVSVMDYDFKLLPPETRVLEPVTTPSPPRCHQCSRYICYLGLQAAAPLEVGSRAGFEPATRRLTAVERTKTPVSTGNARYASCYSAPRVLVLSVTGAGCYRAIPIFIEGPHKTPHSEAPGRPPEAIIDDCCCHPTKGGPTFTQTPPAIPPCPFAVLRNTS